MIRLQHGLHLATVVPSSHFRGSNPPTVVHHVLERVGEKPLTLLGRDRHRVIEAGEEGLPVAHVVQPDVRQA